MKNIEIERLEAKLKLWDTPGFSQFLQDLYDYCNMTNVQEGTNALKKLYTNNLQYLKDKETNFKQGKLPL